MGGAQVSGCDPLSQSSMPSWSSMLKCIKFDLKVPSSIHGRMANKFYGCNQCDYKSKQYNDMCAHVMQAHFDVKDVPFQCPICGACKATKNAFRSHHRQYHKGIDYKPLGSGVAMTELDFIPKHFLPIELLPGTSSDCQLAAEPSVDVPAEPVGAAYPVPESSADVPAEQEGAVYWPAPEPNTSLEKPPTPRDPFMIDNDELYADAEYVEFPEYCQVTQLQSELADKNERIAVLTQSVDQLDAQKTELLAEVEKWKTKLQQSQATVVELQSRNKALEAQLAAAQGPPAEKMDNSVQTKDRSLLNSHQAWIQCKIVTPLQSSNQQPSLANQLQHYHRKKHGHGKSADAKGVKRSKKDDGKKKKDTRRRRK